MGLASLDPPYPYRWPVPKATQAWYAKIDWDQGMMRVTVVHACRWLLQTAALLAAGHLALAAPASEAPVGPASPASGPAAEIDKLVRQLGDNDYFARQQAQDSLAHLGFEAFDALNAAATNKDLEIASRARYLLRRLRAEWMAKDDPPEVRKYLRDYETLPLEGRVSRMHALATLSDGQGILALCRLVRYEQSLVLSKLAAAELLDSQTNAGPPKPAMVQRVRMILMRSKQTAAGWLLTWTRMADHPEAAMKEWNAMVAAEQVLLRHAPSRTRPEIVTALLRFQIGQLERLGKLDEAMAAVGRLADLEHGEFESVMEFGDWLIRQKAWKAVDRWADKFAAQINREPSLLYLVAQAYAEQGNNAKAEETAHRALGLYPGKHPDELERHLNAADQLRKRGRFAWARREFEHVIARGDQRSPAVRAVMVVFAELLHDQGDDLEAAKTLERLVKAVDAMAGRGGPPPPWLQPPFLPRRPGNRPAQNRRPVLQVEIAGLSYEQVLSQMNYFFACHWAKRHDTGKQRAYLDRALENCDQDVDVLIACYRLAGQPPQYHAKIVDLIKKTTAQLQEQVEAEPENHDTCNQLAWLIGNTMGDLDQALKLSKKSLELKPDTGGYYDTLARVYFARDDLQSAVKNQTRALDLEPYSGLIRGQLDFFRAAREAKKGNKP